MKGIRMRFREVTRVSEFERDFKKLLKKYVTLEEDLATMVRAQLGAFHKLGLDTGGVFRFLHPAKPAGGHLAGNLTLWVDW